MFWYQSINGPKVIRHITEVESVKAVKYDDVRHHGKLGKHPRCRLSDRYSGGRAGVHLLCSYSLPLDVRFHHRSDAGGKEPLVCQDELSEVVF